MAEEVTTAVEGGGQQGTEGEQGDQGTGQPEIPPEVKRALSKANKEAETLRLKLKQYEDAEKSEAEKQAEAQRALEQRATEAESRALRVEVALDKGLSPVLAKRLVGSTREELEADADELVKLQAPREAKPAGGGFDGGARSSVKPSGKEAGLAEARKRFGDRVPAK